MPFIASKVNVPVTAEQELALKTRLGKAIELVPGKSEEYLFLGFEDNCHLYLRGNDSRPMAYITASIFGNEDHGGFSPFSAEVTRIYQDVLGIAPENCYIKYEDITAWAVGGRYTDKALMMQSFDYQDYADVIVKLIGDSNIV